MACGNCKTGNNGVPSGCGDKGHCTSGSCNKLNTFDWLTTLEIDDPNSYKFAEVSFKNGARKTFYKVGQNPRYVTGDLVILDAGNGVSVAKTKNCEEQSRKWLIRLAIQRNGNRIFR